jgi:hypothetical protein
MASAFRFCAATTSVMTSRPDSKDSIDGSPYPALLRTASTSEYNTRLRAVAPLRKGALRWLAAQTRVGGAAAADGRQAGAPRGKRHEHLDTRWQCARPNDMSHA